MKRERDPTPEEYEKLLLWIDKDCDEAARKLLLIQSRVTRILISRGCAIAEELAVETQNRIAVRIDKVRESFPDPLRGFIGFLDNVHFEYLRDEKIRNTAIPPPQPRPSEELEREDRCLEECLKALTPQEKNIVVRYFGGDGAERREERKKLAREMNLTANALRIQAHRLRKKSLECLRGCLDES
jgi:DNA-directed RNA polymerase specialized sigma24 family protein